MSNSKINRSSKNNIENSPLVESIRAKHAHITIIKEYEENLIEESDGNTVESAV